MDRITVEDIELINKYIFDSEQQINRISYKDAIVIAQTNSVSGNIEYNVKKAKKWIECAEHIGAAAIVFPELYLLGAPVGDYILKFPIVVQEIQEWLHVLAKNTKKTKVIIGFINFENNKYYNSVAILSNGKIEKIINKSILDNSAENNESRYFEAGNIADESRVINIGDKRALILLGSEILNADNIIKEHSFDIIINCSAAPDRAGKGFFISDLCSEISKKYSVPVMWVNQCGFSDNLSYGGTSRVYNVNGELVYRAKSYEEQFLPVNPYAERGIIFDIPKGSDLRLPKTFSLNYEYDLERTYKTLVHSIRDYFGKTGFKRACLGLSGGLDSTVCAVLLADAIGKENVFGISMPSKITSIESKNDAKELAENLGIFFLEMPIKEMFDVTREKFDEIFSGISGWQDARYKQSYTNDNIQARARATILWGISNEFANCLPIATSDKSEAYMGYATINGDMSGGFAPIADVTKTKLFALAKWLNKNRPQKNVIPQSIIEKRPGAELAINPKTGKPLLAEEALMPYEFLDEIIWRAENLHQTVNDMLDVEFVYEKENKISREQKIEWLEKFFRRMSFALYKWSIFPPAPIVDINSINHVEYSQSIITSGVNYRKTSIEDKFNALKNQNKV